MAVTGAATAAGCRNLGGWRSAAARLDSASTMRSITAGPFLLVLLAAGTAVAQTQADRAYVGYTVAGATAIGDAGTRLDERQVLELRLPLPPVFAGRLVLVPSFGYETRWLGLEEGGKEPDGGDVERTFHRFQLGLTAIRPVAPRWLAIAGLSTTARADFALDFEAGRDLSWTGFAMASYQLADLPGASVTMGVVALYPIDTLPVIPMAAFAYRSPSYVIEVGLPRTSVFMTVLDGLEVGATASFDRQAFRTDVPGSTGDGRYVRETALRVGPAVNASLGAGNLWVSAAVGLDVMNDFAVLDADRDEVPLAMEPSTRPAPYARVLLTWRPPRPARPAPIKR
jgi:hypothetical protein